MNDEIMEVNLLKKHDRVFEESDVWQIVIHPKNEGYGSRSCRDPEFWHARQQFLSSYHFSALQQHNGHRSSRSIRNIISGVVIEFRSGFYHKKVIVQFRKLKAKCYRASLVSTSIHAIRCFIPWWTKKD
ncbi:unnamed protein product [Amaranthus hypochondriacus]